MSQTSLAELLVHALDKQLEGTLVFQEVTGEKSALYFRKGAPAKARLARKSSCLTEALIELGLLSAEESQRSQKRAEAEGRLHSELLLEEGLLEPDVLYPAFREELRRQVLVLCGLPQETGFGFYDVNFLAKWGPPGDFRVKPLPLIWQALVEHFPADKLENVVRKWGDRSLHLRFEAPIARYHISREELSILDVIRAKPQTLASLKEAGVGSQVLVERVVAALILTRQVEGVHEDKKPVGFYEEVESPLSILPSDVAPPHQAPPERHRLPPRPAPAARTVTPPQRVPLPSAIPEAEFEALRAEIEQYRDAKPQTFYELLRVPTSADATQVRAAFFQLARRFHPDKLPAELEELRPIVTRTFARMGEAHQVLTDAHRRAEYDLALSEAPSEEQEKVAAILEAAAAYQRAEVLMKKRDYVGALAQAQLAHQGDDTQADYLALYAWLAAMQRGSDFEEQIQMLDRAIEQEPENVRALWYRGQLLKKMGKTLPAIRDFREIVELRPHHVDAQREIRVYEMRRRTDGKGNRSTTSSGLRPGVRTPTKAPPANKPGGLFGRFLKKD